MCWQRVYTAADTQVICEKVEKSDIPTIDKKKYLVPAVSCLFLLHVTDHAGPNRWAVRLRYQVSWFAVF